MEEKWNANALGKMLPDREQVAELAGSYKKWLRYLIIAETGIAILNTALLTAGAVMYGKKAIEILRKKAEEQS